MNQHIKSLSEVRLRASVEQLEWMLDQQCTQEQRDAFFNLLKAKPADLLPAQIEAAYNLVVRTIHSNNEKGVKPEPVRQIDDPIRRTDAELRQALEWAQDRKKQKPWFPDNDSPKMMTTCNAFIALIEEVLELRGYKSREHVRH